MPKPDVLSQNSHAAFAEDKAKRYLNTDSNIARGHLQEAIAAMENNIHTVYNADTAVQMARIRQTEARTYVLDAMRPTTRQSPVERADSFRRAITALRGHGLDQTGPYISGKKDPSFTGGPTTPHDPLYETKLGAVITTHARTLSMIARVATAQELVLGEVTEDTKANRSRYSDAHFFARSGDDASLLIGNALFAARDARLGDSEEHTGAVHWWVRRAASGLLWALRNDPSNFTTGFGLLRQARAVLQNPQTAREAILAGA